MTSREQAMRHIALRIEIDLQIVARFAHVIEPMSTAKSSGKQHRGQDGCVTAKWLAFTLIAIAIGNTERAVAAITAMNDTLLDVVATEHETHSDVNPRTNRIELTLNQTSAIEQEPADWDLRGQNFLEAFIGLIEQLALAPNGSHHKFLGDDYRIKLSGSETKPYITIKANLVDEKGERFTRTFEYVPMATLEDLAPGSARRSRSKLPIGRVAVLSSHHVEMLAALLVMSRDSQLSALVH